MTASQKKKLIGTNAGVWSIAILTSFILPLIAGSRSSGSGKFLEVLCFAGLLVLGMLVSTMVINNSIDETAIG
jgi:hypothetical protein